MLKVCASEIKLNQRSRLSGLTHRYEFVPGAEPGHQVVLPAFDIGYGDMETVSGQLVSISG